MKSCHGAEERCKVVGKGLQPSPASIGVNSKATMALGGPHPPYFIFNVAQAQVTPSMAKPPLPPPLPCCETALRIIALKIFT